MTNTKYLGVLFFLLSIICTVDKSVAWVGQQDILQGKVLDQRGAKPLDAVRVAIDGSASSKSNAKGEFNITGVDANVRPNKVMAVKQGFELATWEFDQGKITIYMRPATIRTIQGTLKDGTGSPMANKKIELVGLTQYDALTDSQGNFTLTIPYKIDVTKSNIFLVDGIPTITKEFKENKAEATITVGLIKSAKNIATVKVLYKQDVPVTNMIVRIGETSYMTDDKGNFRTEKTDSEITQWDFEGIKPISIDTNESSNVITVILPSETRERNRTNSMEKAIAERTLTSMDSTEIAKMFRLSVSDEVAKLLEFYNQQSVEIEVRNKNINRITDSLTFYTNFDDDSKTEFLQQLNVLNKSIETTSNDFDEIKANSLLLIKRLRAILLEQEEIIKEIEVEKEMQAQKFRRNVMLFIYFFGIAAFLLLIAVFIARRLSAQKKVIERIKNQLSDAQVIAKMGSMTYFIKKKQAVFSEHFFEILGISNPEKIKKIQRTSNHFINPTLLLDGEVKKVDEAFNQGLKDLKPFSLEIKTAADEKRSLYVDLRSSIELDANGNPIAVSSTLQDISEKKERELALVRANREAAEANKAKEHFLSTMSHEIRTPLNAIIGLTDQLIKNKPQDHQMKNLNTLQFSGEHLLTLVNDILDYNKIQAGKVVLEEAEFNLYEMTKSIINTMTIMADTKSIELKINFDKKVPKIVKGDKLRLNQILTNLISNGIKFTEKGHVLLEVSLEENTAEQIQLKFSVIDTGSGIHPTRLEKIFEGFEQESASTSRKYGGTGLGLSISKQLVLLLGGELKVKSKINEGSEFYFTTLLNHGNPESKSGAKNNQANKDQKGLAGVRILCVDDNEVNQLVISQYFDSWKVDATYASNGNDAVECFRKGEYELILMDIRLPDIKGYEAVQKMRDEFPKRNTPAIALTAEMNEALKKKIKEHGMVDHLNKPFNADDLYNKINTHVSRSGTPK